MRIKSICCKAEPAREGNTANRAHINPPGNHCRGYYRDVIAINTAVKTLNRRRQTLRQGDKLDPAFLP
ncbi:MAG: hypothetical protein GX263_05655 [Firmicutes bacterium]|nr:hypothetical protein [Bacillota bacterium]